MFEYPFQAQIWGTVSDWAIVGITAATAYFLYKTLKSQKDVQETQVKLFEIEKIRLREQYKPLLKFSHHHLNTETDKPNQRITSVKVTNESDRIAFNLKPLYLNKGGAKVIAYKPNSKQLIKNEEPAYYHFLSENFEDDFTHFGVTYEDVTGIKYRQTFLLILWNNDVEISVHMPQIIN